MSYDFTKAFSSGGNRAPISEEEWAGGWVAIVGGINGIPTAQQFNTFGYIIESKVNEAHGVASRALSGLDNKVDKAAGYDLMSEAQAMKLGGISAGATKTAKSSTNGNVLVDGAEIQVYRHPTGAGNEHIPAGRTAGQVLQKTDSGYTWGAVTPTDVESPIKNATALTAIDDADTVPFTDISDSSKTKKITWANIKALLNTWASALFAPKSHTHDDRYYTEMEMESKLSGKLGTSGDGKDTTVTFAEAASRVAPATGESQATLWGKVKKLFTDLKAVAFSGSYTDLSNIPNSFTPSSHTHGAGDINSGTLDAARIPGLPASKITSGTLSVARGGTGQSTLTESVVTKAVRQIYAGTSDMTAGTTALTTGVIYLVYE